MRFDTLLKISNLRPLMVYVSLPKSRGAFQYFIKSPKHTTGSTLGTWGLMRINSFLLLIQSPKDSYKFQSWHLGANAD